MYLKSAVLYKRLLFSSAGYIVNKLILVTRRQSLEPNAVNMLMCFYSLHGVSEKTV